MPMNRFFSDEFSSAHKTLSAGGYKASYRNCIKKLAKFSAPAGPHIAYASVLPEIWRYVITDGNFGFFSRGKMVNLEHGTLAATGDYDAANIGDYAQVTRATREKLAALVLFLHTSVEGERGAQKVLVCALPKSFSDWPLALFNASNIAQLLGYLADADQRFESNEKKSLANAVQQAQAWCQRALITLAQATSDKTARNLVKLWFADQNTSEQELDLAISKLQAGFKRILAVLSSNRLVLTDHPQIRNAVPNTEDYDNLQSEAFVKKSREKMNVIYIEEKFFDNQIVIDGSRDWARILIHETSHRELGNVDHRYAYSGIKPTVDRLPFAKTICNADSWAFFCVDAAGQLNDNERNFALRR